MATFATPLQRPNAPTLMHFPGRLGVHSFAIGQHWKIVTRVVAIQYVITRNPETQSAQRNFLTTPKMR